MFWIVKKARYEALERSVKELRDEVARLASLVREQAEMPNEEREDKRSLADVLNEWVYGKAGDAEGDE